jgi:hypothetical protein
MTAYKDVKSEGLIKSMRLSSDWSEGETESGNIGYRYLRPFKMKDNDAVRIVLFYRGMPISPQATDAFRKYLKGRTQILFADNEASPSAEASIRELSEVLDNTANNQLLNKEEEGWQGPHFLLKKVEVTRIAARTVLSVRGCFIEPGTTNRLNEYWGIFADGKPDSAECPVEEIYFEAPSEELFQRHVSQFFEALGTIHWRFDAFDRQPQ